MTLLVILVCLTLERYLYVGSLLYRFRWFDAYLNFLNKRLYNTHLMQGYWAIASVIIPILILVGLVGLLVHDKLHGLLGFVYAALILLYCLGPDNVYVLVAKSKSEKLNEFSQDTPMSVQSILWRANDTLFAVIFWFAVLGPIGAVLYRITFLLDQAAQPHDSEYHHLHTATSPVLGMLDWLPVRLETFAFALVGNFKKVLSYWLEHIFTSWHENLNLVIACGYLAEGWQPGLSLEQEETKTALALIDRSLIIFVAVIALFTMGYWLYFL